MHYAKEVQLCVHSSQMTLGTIHNPHMLVASVMFEIHSIPVCVLNHSQQTGILEKV